MLSYLLSFTVHILVMQRAQTTTPMAVYTYSGVSCNKLSNKSTYCTALSIHRDMQCTKLLASITDVHVQTVQITLGKSVIMICQQIYPQINSLRLHYIHTRPLFKIFNATSFTGFTYVNKCPTHRHLVRSNDGGWGICLRTLKPVKEVVLNI